MITRRGLFGILAAGTAALLAGCGSRETIRYKLTVEVETPEGVKSGHSVNEVIWGGASPVAKAVFGGLAGGSMDWRGEAVAVDLPKGQTLFVLLHSAASEEWAGWVSQDVPKDGSAAPVPRKDNMGNDNIPYFVRFKDIADPKSVEQVYPDDFAKSFGAGYRLKTLTLQRTSEPVTVGIGNRLPLPPYVRSFAYDGAESDVLDLHRGKQVTEVIGLESFVRGTTK
jgi:hypothetical protein